MFRIFFCAVIHLLLFSPHTVDGFQHSFPTYLHKYNINTLYYWTAEMRLAVKDKNPSKGHRSMEMAKHLFWLISIIGYNVQRMWLSTEYVTQSAVCVCVISSETLMNSCICNSLYLVIFLSDAVKILFSFFNRAKLINEKILKICCGSKSLAIYFPVPTDFSLKIYTL